MTRLSTILLSGFVVAVFICFALAYSLKTSSLSAQRSMDGTQAVLKSAVKDVAQLTKMCGVPCMDYQYKYAQEVRRQIEKVEKVIE
jgi:hypothetical protein